MSLPRAAGAAAPQRDERPHISCLSVSVDHQSVRVTGVLDEVTVELLLGTTSALLSHGERDVTIDLNGATRIDSAALRELFSAQTDTPPETTLHLIAPPRLRPRLAICVLDSDTETAGAPNTSCRETSTIGWGNSADQRKADRTAHEDRPLQGAVPARRRGRQRGARG